MNIIKTIATASALLLLSPGAAFAAYDGWIAGGMGVYSATAATATAAKDAATAKCMAAEGIACSGAFALSSGTPVVTAACMAGNMSGYVVGQSRNAVEKTIMGSAFGMEACALSE